jgi:hypothetical protein
MADRTPPPYEKPPRERRTPLGNDVDPDGMDSDSEGDELEAGYDNDAADSDAANGPDGSLDRQTAGQRRTSGTHGAADTNTTAPRRGR